jgi:hypothetical protein
MTTDPAFAARVRELRRQRGLSQLAWYQLPEDAAWTADVDRTVRYLVLMVLSDGEQAFEPRTAEDIVAAYATDPRPGAVEAVERAAAELVAAGLLESRRREPEPPADEETEWEDIPF